MYPKANNYIIPLIIWKWCPHMVVDTYVHVVKINSCIAVAAWPEAKAAFFFQMVGKLR